MERLPDTNPAAVRRFWAAIDAGGLVVYPTDTLYGMGVAAQDQAALERLTHLKDRPGPFSVMVGRYEQLNEYALISPPLAVKLSHMLPGPFTFLLPARDPDSLPLSVMGPGGRIGCRVPEHRFLREAYALRSDLVVTTSVNLSGEPPIQDPDLIANRFGDDLDLLIDGGVLPPSLGSTLVDTNSDPWQILRPGDGLVPDHHE
ncbi:MAG: L-threonylcarbamoyladenylate synthase [Candidatus Neomarinimicrobiota bacterium]